MRGFRHLGVCTHVTALLFFILFTALYSPHPVGKLLRVMCTRATFSWTPGPRGCELLLPSRPPTQALLISSRKQCGHPEESDTFYLWFSVLCNFLLQFSEEQLCEDQPRSYVLACLWTFFLANKWRKEIDWPRPMAILSGKAFVQGWVGSAKNMEAAVSLGLLTSLFPPFLFGCFTASAVFAQMDACGNQAWINSPNFLLPALGLSWKVQCDPHLLLLLLF